MPTHKEPASEGYSHSSETLDNFVNVERALSSPPPPPQGGIWNYLNQTVDAHQSTIPLATYSFMTGFIDAVSFVAIFVWCGFQTGNFVQLAVASSRLFSSMLSHREKDFGRSDQQALTSFLAFNLGASLERIGDKIGPLTRLWLVLGTIVQALFTMAGSIAIWKNGQPSVATDGALAWTDSLSFVCIAFLSASLGLQGGMAKKLNTAFGTTVVLTTIWCELVADPKLFSRRRIPSRDHKLIAASCILMGAFVGCALVGQIGAAGALGVGTGIRVAVALQWMFVPAV